MELFLTYLKVFITGGLICTIGQILIDKTNLTPARILVVFVTAEQYLLDLVYTNILLILEKQVQQFPSQGLAIHYQKVLLKK